MKRQTFTAALAIDGDIVAMIDKYAHNSAMRAGIDALRDYARGGYWHPQHVDKTAEMTMAYYRHDDGREAVVTVNRPAS